MDGRRPLNLGTAPERETRGCQVLVSGLVFSVVASIIASRLWGRYIRVKDNARATLVLQGLIGGALVASAGFLPVSGTVVLGDSSSVIWLFPWDVSSAGVWVTCFFGVVALVAWFQYDRAPDTIRGGTVVCGVVAYGTALLSEGAGINTLQGALRRTAWIDQFFLHRSTSPLHVYSFPVSVLPVTFGASWLVISGWRITYEYVRRYVLKES